MPSLFSKISLFLLVSVFVSSCTDLDDAIEAPSDFYYTGSLPIPFYSNGNSDLPNNELPRGRAIEVSIGRKLIFSFMKT